MRFAALLGTMAITLGAQPFPDTEALMRAVAQHQKDIEAFGNVRHFEGYIEQRKVHNEVWLPSHREYVANGRELFKGFRFRQLSDFGD